MEVAREDSGDGDFEPCEMLMDRFGVRKEVRDGDFACLYFKTETFWKDV